MMKMPALTRHHLASRLRSNWMAKHPMDCNSNGGTTLDDSLTSLNWLQNLNIMKITSPTTTVNHMTSYDNHKNIKVNPNTVLNVSNVPIKQEPSFNLGDTPPSTPTSFGNEVDYSTNPYVKPPYSYATLICMAMKETKKSKITLSAIYNWITENFMYYRVADPSWQNSIRHNLSLNKCFQKVPRRKDEPGKGGFWRINPEHGDLLENGVFKKRRNSRDVCLTPSKRMKSVDDDEFDYCDQYNDNKLTQEGTDPSLSRAGSTDLDDTHLPDFNWASILNQDIEIGGVTIKTEQLLDRDTEASPLIEMSPPSSETNSDDIGFDDFLVPADFSSDLSNDAGAVDYTSNSPLDLTVSGQGIRAPDWWEETLEGSEENRDPNINTGRNGLHTPVTVEENPWVEQCRDYTGLDDIAAAFDIDNLFDVENIPSPKIG